MYVIINDTGEYDMEQNTISLLEVIKLMKEVRHNTDSFLNSLKSSIYIEKNGIVINPGFIYINFFDNCFYSLTVDGYPFILDSNGIATFFFTGLNNDMEAESQIILDRNKNVITDALNHLNSNPPKYYATITNVKGYMSFQEDVDDFVIKGNCNSISIFQKDLNRLIVNYNVRDNIVSFGYSRKKFPLDLITEISDDSDSVKDYYRGMNETLKNTQIDIDNLPLVLKNQIESKHKDIIIK